MPTYEYACKSCGEHVEVVQSFTDDPLTSCEACGGQLRKVFGSVGVVLKGSGFYRTDNRVGPRKGESTRTEAKAGASESGGDSGKDAKDSKSTTAAKGDSKVASGAGSASKPA